MKFQFTPDGTLDTDPRGAHVMMTYHDRELLGTVMDFFYSQDAGWLLQVQHFNGEPWPLLPPINSVEVLQRVAEIEVGCNLCGKSFADHGNDVDAPCPTEPFEA